MNNKEISKDKEHPHFITIVSSARRKILLTGNIPTILIENLAFYRKLHDFKLIGFVIMPDHVHLIIYPQGHNAINTILHDYKSYTAQIINIELKQKGSFWHKGFNDRLIRSHEELNNELRYIHNNPLKAGLVDNIEDYKFSSWQYYEDLIKDDLIDKQW
ncbi:MAG: hypothetical protein A2509_05030 [Candidatus Edwardsbacteria bacterium RIFOXYD12_FULL_50_11]|uniref:Transposase IS200-like domain-containing protein n=1 Tax=Candidatus Edwardsbacteria bacterium GWF2_54_11 TaxID=1817851 RepID=A0A1F5R448_9BACT|nr:MAG: hypothetical protein A2502_11105 [Candidatus Edwardsbacteria bacterium RifOxyC12_full_54_24]OGF08357.1 MAG: hypothetical protein A2273_08405 [Candidatus Edwardsbacteria bacterium RifOxyA12_full_54_48]OGF09230.1 MAG: hypothetical protein A2024_05160 [Candidatus Edwardsbacteria bacterium GWF2_54_11]OGF11654.1 MAG: hypothetical protein A3K15_04885 [Candidatus Edwardsbacteria bacterium GWE2_54_12]OGF17693.1 MAG: hypothetical protein A2509_05030 [Candidatus Edwardsbacteria bacterium RIFOXYD1